MLQLIGILAISWLLVWLFDKSSLMVLGLWPTKNRLILIAKLFVVTAVCGSTAFLFKIYFAEEQLIIKPNLTTNLVLTEIWGNIIKFSLMIDNTIGFHTINEGVSLDSYKR